MYFWSNGLWKTWLDKCVKCRVSEDPSTSNMGNGPKHCQKLNDSTFTIFIDPCERNSGWRSHSKWYAKSKDCLLTHYLLITGFLSLIETIYSNIFRTIYARMEKYVLHFFFFFFFTFSKYKFNFEHFQTRDDRHSWCICQITDSEKRC